MRSARGGTASVRDTAAARRDPVKWPLPRRAQRQESRLNKRGASRGRGISVAGTPERVAVIKRAKELVDFARLQGYRVDELLKIIEDETSRRPGRTRLGRSRIGLLERGRRGHGVVKWYRPGGRRAVRERRREGHRQLVALSSRRARCSPARFPEAVYVQADVSREDDARRLVATTLERFGRVDVVVNDAGTTRRVPFAGLEGADEELWQRILGVNLMGPGTSAVRRCLRYARPGGRSSTCDRSPGSSRLGTRCRTPFRRRRCTN